jgi:4-diphosphocytidyl-2-C-methyl-D-erythritol kinase
MVTFPNCKINLGLFVTEKRPNGYHTLETIFLPGSLHDVLELVINENEKDAQIFMHNASFDIDKSKHSCYQSWKVLHDRFGIPAVDIHLIKNIPSGAGLGGGSADAAFTMTMLNEMFALALQEEELIEMASKVGSDNAFFIINSPCFVNGVGHELERMDFSIDFKIDITSPPVSISTAEAYQWIVPKPASFDLRLLPTIPKHEWKDVLRNDFEEGAIAKYPIIQEYIQAHYNRGAFYAAMSGSGSSVFGLY